MSNDSKINDDIKKSPLKIKGNYGIKETTFKAEGVRIVPMDESKMTTYGAYTSSILNWCTENLQNTKGQANGIIYDPKIYETLDLILPYAMIKPYGSATAQFQDPKKEALAVQVMTNNSDYSGTFVSRLEASHETTVSWSWDVDISASLSGTIEFDAAPFGLGAKSSISATIGASVTTGQEQAKTNVINAGAEIWAELIKGQTAIATLSCYKGNVSVTQEFEYTFKGDLVIQYNKGGKFKQYYHTDIATLFAGLGLDTTVISYLAISFVSISDGYSSLDNASE